MAIAVRLLPLPVPRVADAMAVMEAIRPTALPIIPHHRVAEAARPAVLAARVALAGRVAAQGHGGLVRARLWCTHLPKCEPSRL